MENSVNIGDLNKNGNLDDYNLNLIVIENSATHIYIQKEIL